MWTLPANATVHVTLLNYDGQSGLRNPFLAQARGIDGGMFTLNGKKMSSINPDEASHTFAIPDLNVIVPIEGVADDAKNQCDDAPCDSVDARTRRSPSRSTRGRRVTTAGSASCRARRDSSTASAARCRRSATWTGS